MPFNTLHFGFGFVLNIQGSIRFSFHFILSTFWLPFIIFDLNTNKFPIIFVSGCLIQVGLETFHFIKWLFTSLSFDDDVAICSKLESFHHIVLTFWFFLVHFLIFFMKIFQSYHFDFFQISIFLHLTTMTSISALFCLGTNLLE